MEMFELVILDLNWRIGNDLEKVDKTTGVKASDYVIVSMLLWSMVCMAYIILYSYRLRCG